MHRVFAAVAVIGFRGHGTLGNASDPLRLKEKVGGAHVLALGVHGMPERGSKSFGFVTGGTFQYKAPANVFGFFFNYFMCMEPVCQPSVWVSADTFLPLQPRMLT